MAILVKKKFIFYLCINFISANFVYHKSKYFLERKVNKANVSVQIFAHQLPLPFLIKKKKKRVWLSPINVFGKIFVFLISHIRFEAGTEQW